MFQWETCFVVHIPSIAGPKLVHTVGLIGWGGLPVVQSSLLYLLISATRLTRCAGGAPAPVLPAWMLDQAADMAARQQAQREVQRAQRRQQARASIRPQVHVLMCACIACQWSAAICIRACSAV